MYDQIRFGGMSQQQQAEHYQDLIKKMSAIPGLLQDEASQQKVK